MEFFLVNYLNLSGFVLFFEKVRDKEHLLNNSTISLSVFINVCWFFSVFFFIYLKDPNWFIFIFIFEQSCPSNSENVDI